MGSTSVFAASGDLFKPKRFAGLFVLHREYPTREKHKFRSENSPEIVDTISFSNRLQIMDLVTTASTAPTRSFSRNPVRAFYQSSIGKKITVAVTGIILIVFVVGHLLGNLEIYLGPDHTNWYAEFLRSTGPLLWIVR